MWQIKPDQLVAGRRKALLEVLRNRPGLGFREVVRASGLAAGVCDHHLRVLERYGLAWSTWHGSRRRTFAGPRPSNEVAAYLARCAGIDAGMASILAFVRTNPGCFQKTIIEAFTGRTPASTVQHQLGRLQREGFVTRAAQGRWRRHFAALPPVALGSTARGDDVVQMLVRTNLTIVPGGIPKPEQTHA